jgi:small subunit ribosomal protein S1
MVLAVDAERERISLGVKQLMQDPFSMYVADHNKGAIVTGTVSEVDAKGAVITLAGGVDGVLKASEMSKDRVDDARTLFNVNDTVESKIINVDRKNRVITLSIKAKDVEDEAETLREYNRSGEESGGNTTLGDLLKEKMENKGQ